MRRTSLIVIVLCLASALLAACHYYIARRLVLDPGLAQPWRGLAIAALCGLAATLVLQPIGERWLRPARARLIAWPASLWMGFAFLLLVGLGVSDLVLWLAGGVAEAAQELPGPGPGAGVRAAAVASIALLAGLAGLRSGLAPPQLRRVELELPRWPAARDGYRIAQISDIHIGPILGRAFAEQLVARVNALAPDLVAVTGDLVDGSVALLADEVAPFAGLRGRDGVFFVTGNHDHYSGADDWSGAVGGLGMRVLRNQRVAIGQGAGSFDLVGVDDHRGGHLGGGREDLDRALAGRDAARPAILLAHDPSTFKRAATRGIDLQLSGHTHGGQIWPFGLLVKLVIPTVAGRYAKGDAQLYVSRGTGFWGPPMRLFAPAEITEIVLRSPRAIESGRSPATTGAAR
jgi:predicted MPP superfamily phosphohydrolase